MQLRRRFAEFALALGLAACSTTTAPASAPHDAAFTVMSFNVRYGTADDGPDAWPKRREQLLDVIRQAAPAVLGVQEALDFQVAFLEAGLPRYVRVGAGREGDARGEHASLFVDSARFEIRAHGDFWLSEEPERVASVGWDAALTRMCTWAELREQGSGHVLTVWNTHFDHRGTEARKHAAELIAARVLEREGPRLVLGDLNAGEASEPLAVLLGAGLRDTFRALHPGASAVGTFHAFRGGTGGEKIDHILATPDLEPRAAAVLSSPGANGRWPSDHHAVCATLAFAPRGHRTGARPRRRPPFRPK